VGRGVGCAEGKKKSSQHIVMRLFSSLTAFKPSRFKQQKEK
jgi:hypothetical protein